MELSSKTGTNLFSNFKHDFPASVVVFFVAVPLCLGIALASGAPLFSGIIAGIVGGIIVGTLSNSSLGVSGPAAGLTIIVLSSIEKLGSFEAFLLAVVLAGIFQIVLGLLKAGIIAYYFPSAVIKGMLAAIGIIIVLKQIPHAFGYDNDYEGDLSFFQLDGRNTFTELLSMVDSITPGACVICFIAVLILLLWETIVRKKIPAVKWIPGPLIAVFVGILYQWVTKNFYPVLSLEPIHLVSVPVAESFSGFFDQFSSPDFGFIVNGDIWVVAFTIAVVASIETLLSVEATDKLDKFKRITNTNRELIAQGTGNMVSGLIGGIPVTQVILRSSANIQSGGRTKLSTIIHGMLLLICVAAIPHVLNLVPLAVLAAILFVIGFKLAKPSSFVEMYRLGWSQFLPFIVTVLGVVFTDLLMGITMGLAVSVVVILKNSFKNSHFLHLEKNGNEDEDRVKIRLAEEVYFLNKGAILRELDKIKEKSFVTIDMSRSVSIDYDVKEVIDNFMESAAAKNIRVEIITESTEEPMQVEANPESISNINESIQRKVMI